MNLISKVVISTAIALASLNAYTQSTNNYDVFKAECLEAVGGNEKKVNDVEEYQNYNNKICACFADELKEIDRSKTPTEEDITKLKATMGSCIAQNYLARVMHKVKNDEPPTVEKILAACDEENKAIFAEQTDEDIALGKKLCSCSANKIMTLDKEKQTDADNLKNIFMDCAKQLRE